MEKCDFSIKAAIGGDCNNPVLPGMKNEGVICNYNDVDFDNCTRDAQNRNIITNFVLKSGKKGYPIVVPGSTPFNNTAKTLVTSAVRNKFNKVVSFVVLDNGPDVCRDIIDNLANGTFVVILENKYQGANRKGAFEIYGFEQGLAATTLEDNRYSEETDGGWSVQMQETNAPTSGIYLFDENVDSSRRIFESLTASVL